MLFEKIPVRRLSQFLIGYMLLAFGWWSYHLWCQNNRLFAAEKAALELKFDPRNNGQNLSKLVDTKEYKALQNKWNRERRMVVMEGLFFTLCLVIGLWLINRSARRELDMARQRRNFMLSITHELKSPLASLRLMLDTLCKHDLERVKVEKLCKNGLKDVDRLQSLVEDLLLAARLEDNWRPFIEAVDLYALLRDIRAGLQVRFPHANLQVHIPKDFPPVQADRSGLTSVVQNLLENAIKYSPEGTTVAFDADKMNGRLRLRVADEGQGIPDAEKKAVFEKFYRLGNEETRQTNGTGLGLYIVRQVVKAHGGTIQVTDNQPKGTVFTLEI
ncbi:MAG: HAMP domain-containing sensor histidine kinase [Saprospiraceae bacterium]